MIEINLIFSGWHQTTKEKARYYILDRLYTLSGRFKKDTFKYINENILRGIKVEDLIVDADLVPAIKENIYGRNN